MSLGPSRVLDAGCGTGRVAIELARLGVSVVGVDVDPEMLDVARSKAPELDWRLADLSELNLDHDSFDVVVMAGNVLLFVQPGTEERIIANLTQGVTLGGMLVSGFQTIPGRIDAARYDSACSAAGLTLVERWSTWDRHPWDSTSSYAVSVHRWLV